MKKLNSLIEAIATKQAEINTEEASHEQATQELAEIGRRGNYEKEIKRLGEAGARAQIIPVRLKTLCGELGDIEEALAVELGRWARLWNSFVSDKADYEFSRFIETALPFFGGRPKEKVTRLEFEFFHLPSVSRIKRALLDLGDYHQITYEARLALAKRVTNHCQFWWAEFGIKLPVDIPTGSRAPKEKCPKTVKVRAREDFTATALVEHSSPGDVKRNPGLIREGAVLEVSVRTFRALSRFLSPIEPLADVVLNTPDCYLP
jgi:hypothetical protein